jgi:hypothetical protein
LFDLLLNDEQTTLLMLQLLGEGIDFFLKSHLLCLEEHACVGSALGT